MLSLGVSRCIVCGGTAASKRKDGPDGVAEENSDDKSGRINSRSRGSSCDREAKPDLAACSSDCWFASRGRLRGRAPPN